MKWFNQLFKKETKPKESKLTVAARRYEKYKPSSLQRIFSSDMSILQVSVCKPNVESYTAYVKYLIESIKFDESIQNVRIVKDSQRIFLRDFFINEKGFYTNPEESFQEFRDSVVELLDLCDTKEKTSDKSFELERNLRLTGPVVLNLCSLLEELPTP